jgi:predicted RNase H-like HicB family nuclease
LCPTEVAEKHRGWPETTTVLHDWRSGDYEQAAFGVRSMPRRLPRTCEKILEYIIEIIPDEDGYVAAVPDLPGCMSSGKTVNAALRGLDEVKELWLQGRIEAGEEIPEPAKIEDFSGKFVLRIPRSLHRSLDHEARKEGVSLNQLILYILSDRHHVALR